MALANAKESLHQPFHQQLQVKTVDNQLKQLEQTDKLLKSEMQLKNLNHSEQADQLGGDLVEQLKPAEQCEPDDQLKPADELKPIENVSETVVDQSIEKQARNGDVNIHMGPNVSDKVEVQEEMSLKGESRVSVEDEEDAMEALLSHDMRETEIR